MIIVRLIGGLGNQLFQYAAARRLALKYNVPLKLDVTPFTYYKLHNYSLQHFNIVEEFASPEEISRFSPDSRLKRLFSRLTARPKVGSVFYGRDYVFEEDILRGADNLYMIGYWQSEDYFSDITSVIRAECTIKTPQRGLDAEFAAQIAETESVSIHVRRMDFVTDQKNRSIYRACGEDYYTSGIAYLAERLTSPHIFVFSDDIDWAQKNLSFGYPTHFVGHNDASRNFEDLRLMNQCRHNIIANSSFSWWGAWLNQNPDKIVIAPKKWLSNADTEPENLIPKSWITI